MGNGRVGKITMPEDARNELEIAKYLSSIPNAPKYTLPPDVNSCVPLKKSKQKERDLGACEFLSGTQLTQTIQLTMPWGGYPLSRIDLDPAKFSFTQFMEHILAIGAFLALNDLCHFDMWGNNFLLDSTMKPRLIDYGFTFRPSQLNHESLTFRWRQFSPDHDTEPPEVAVMQGIDKDMSLEAVVTELESQKPAVLRLLTMCDVQPADWAFALLSWANSSKSFQQQDWLSCWKLYWPGFDAWSMGAMLLEVYEIQILARGSVRGSVVEQDGKIKDVLRGLCAGSPIARLDAVEALSLLSDGSHELVAPGSAGAAWVAAKQKQRHHSV